MRAINALRPCTVDQALFVVSRNLSLCVKTRCWRGFGAILSTLLLTCLSSTAFAETGIEVESIGLDGRFMLGRQAALRAKVTADEAGDYTVVVLAPDPHGNAVEFASSQFTLAAGESKSASVSFYLGQVTETLNLRLDSTDGTVASARVRFGPGIDDQHPALVPGVRLIACLGSPGGLSLLRTAKASDEDDADPANELVNLSTADFPESAGALDAVNTIIITGDFDLNERQANAIEDWVLGGGHLLIAAPDDLAPFRSSPIGQFVRKWISIAPEQETIAELEQLSTFASAPSRIKIRNRVPIAQLGEARATVSVRGPGRAPLIVNRTVGFGQITCTAFDLSTIPEDEDATRYPVRNWDHLPSLMELLVTQTRSIAKEMGITSGRIGYVGVTDLATQLHSAHVQFPEVQRSGSWWVMGLVLGYLAVVGPIDYLIVHKLLKRPRLTWFTFPIIVAGGCALGIYLAGESNGTETKVNQTTIVDIDAESNTCRTHAWVSVYTPVARKSTLQFGVSDELTATLKLEKRDPVLLTWAGVPENTFGGMLRSGGVGLGSESYASKSDVVEGVPMPVWSTRDLRSKWTASATPPVDSKLKLTGNRMLDGSITHSFPGELKNWSIAHNGRIYVPRPNDDQAAAIPANRIWPVKARSRGRAIASELTNTRVIIIRRKMGEGGDTSRDVQATYDALSTDAAYIMRMLSLHEAAGGTSYTGLTNTLLTELDLSRIAAGTSTAVLMAEVDLPASQISLDDEQLKTTRSRTFVRILLPVAEPEE